MIALDEQDYRIGMEVACGAARDSLVEYTKLCDPNYVVEAMHERIAEELAAVERGETKRLIISCPPRHGKSRLVAIEWPTHVLARDPSQKFIVASHSSALAIEHSREARDRMRHPFYMAMTSARIRPDKSQVKHWKLIEGGEYHTAGVKVKISGFGADKLIVDDPFADYSEAHSPTVRDSVWNWFGSTARTRLSPGGAIVIIGTRWHKDDLIGRLTDPERVRQLEAMGLGRMKWKQLIMPAIARAGDQLGRKVGEALCPQRWKYEELMEIKGETHPFMWSALYDCNPVLIGGNYIKTSDFAYCDPHEVPANQTWMRFWDLACTEDTMADHTASVKGCLTKDGTLYLADMVRGQWEWPKARSMIKTYAEAEKIYIGIEAVAGFKTAYQNAKEVITCVPIKQVNVSKDKLTRALPWIAKVGAKIPGTNESAKKVVLVRGDWIGPFLSECESFKPGADEDDQIDAVSGVFEMLRGGTLASKANAGREAYPPGRGPSRMRKGAMM